MNLDRYIEAIDGCSSMKDFKRNIGMEKEKSLHVLTSVLCGCVADRVKAIKHTAEFYADYACGHGDGELGRKAEALANAMQSLEEAFRD